MGILIMTRTVPLVRPTHLPNRPLWPRLDPRSSKRGGKDAYPPMRDLRSLKRASAYTDPESLRT